MLIEIPKRIQCSQRVYSHLLAKHFYTDEIFANFVAQHPPYIEPEHINFDYNLEQKLTYLKKCRKELGPRIFVKIGEIKQQQLDVDNDLTNLLKEGAEKNHISPSSYLTCLLLLNFCEAEIYVSYRRNVDKLFAFKEYKLRTSMEYPETLGLLNISTGNFRPFNSPAEVLGRQSTDYAWQGYNGLEGRAECSEASQEE